MAMGVSRCALRADRMRRLTSAATTGRRVVRGVQVPGWHLIPSRAQGETNGLLYPTLSSKGGEGANAEAALLIVSS